MKIRTQDMLYCAWCCLCYAWCTCISLFDISGRGHGLQLLRVCRSLMQPFKFVSVRSLYSLYSNFDNAPAICKRPSMKREPSLTPKVKSEPEVESPCLPCLQSSPSNTDEISVAQVAWKNFLHGLPATEAVWTVLADPGNQWLQNIKQGICIGTHFSGMKTPEVALQQLLQATGAVSRG